MIRIGTDCSGIEAPIEALKNVCKIYNKDYEHIFSSEIDKYAIKYIQLNHKPQILYNDITERDINTIPDFDIYVSGAPCQGFSKANKFKIDNDPRCDLFKTCIRVIEHKKPKIFILENVKTMVTLNDGSYFKDILKRLNNLDIYHIHYKVLNTKDFGIPQCRDRLFIIGIKKDLSKRDFVFPIPLKMKNIHKFIDKQNTSKDPIKELNIELFKNIPKDAVFIDVGFRKAKFPNSNRWAPCITAQPNMWCVPMERKASVKEYLQLQGFPINVIQPISDHQMKKKIGNSMTVNIIEKLLLISLKCIKYI